MNTEAKYLLEDIDFSGEGAHLAMTLNEYGGSAAGARDNEGAYLYKADNLSEEALAEIKELEKSEVTPLEENSPVEKVEKSDQENTDSNAMLESNVNDDKANNGINKNNKEESMTTEVTTEVVEKTEEVVEVQTQTQDVEAIAKTLSDVQALLKAEQEARKAAEDKANEIAKAAEDERIEKAKADLTEVVQGWDLEKAEDVVEADLVEALFKSEQSDVLMKAMEHLNSRIETLKSEFGSEKGEDGELVVEKTDVEKTKSSVAEILKARKEKAKAAKAGK